jgi:hypothetical protein
MLGGAGAEERVRRSASPDPNVAKHAASNSPGFSLETNGSVVVCLHCPDERRHSTVA